jgi:hypothetical protein
MARQINTAPSTWGAERAKLNNNSLELYTRVGALETELETKVSSVAGKTGDVTLDKADVGLSDVDNTTDADKPVSTATQEALDEKVGTALLAQPNGVATLGADGKVPTSQMGSLSPANTYVVLDQTERLALTSALKGDFAVESLTNTTWILADNAPTVLASWVQVVTPASVVSVAGKTGAVALVKADVGLTDVDNTSDDDKPISIAAQAALDAKVNLDAYSAKGALLVGTAAAEIAAISVGTDGQVLQANSELAGGMEWATLPAAVAINDQATDGYVDIGNMRIQWGIAGTASGLRTITLPAPFRDANYSVTANTNSAASDPPQLSRLVMLGGKTASSFKGRVVQGSDDSSNFAFQWQAIGLKPA